MKHLIIPAIAMAMLAAVSGCQNRPAVETQPAPPARQVTPTPLVSGQNLPPATVITEVTSADLLPVKTQSWAHQAESLVSRHTRRPVESIAETIQPGDLHIGSPATRKSEPAMTIVPMPRPTIDQSPSSVNQGSASITAPAAPSAGGTIGANTASSRLLGDSVPRSIPPMEPAGDLDRTITKRLGENGKDLWAHLDYQLFQFLKDKPTPQMDVLARLATEDREVLAAVMDALTLFRGNLRADANMLMSRKVKPFLDMADRLRVQADLVIPTVALCKEVEGFGVYKPFEPARFTAMREQEVIVYCEVENFAAHMNDNRLWQTQLSQEIVLYTETGLPVWQTRNEKVLDQARRRRHDFFIFKKTKFPANITIGRYLLKVTIVDQQASRVAEATIPVQFVAQQ